MLVVPGPHRFLGRDLASARAHGERALAMLPGQDPLSRYCAIEVLSLLDAHTGAAEAARERAEAVLEQSRQERLRLGIEVLMRALGVAAPLIGAGDDIVRPPETSEFDWEVELAVVIGAAVRRARGADAERAIAGFTVLNDITCRDWQFRTREWLQGKIWDSSTPVGPYLVTPDELPGGCGPRSVCGCW